MIKHIKVSCFGPANDFRFHFTVPINLKSNCIEKHIRARAREEVDKIKKEWIKNSYGCSFGKIKSLCFERETIKF